MTSNSQAPVQDINRQFEEREAQKRADSFGLEYIDIEAFPLNPDVLRTITEVDARQGEILPFHKNNRALKVAVLNPKSAETRKILSKLEASHIDVELFVCSQTGFDAVVKWYQSNLIQRKTIQLEDHYIESTDGNFESAFLGFQTLAENIYNLTTPEALNEIEMSALKVKASDIHFQPYEEKVVLRFRLDGILHDICEMEMEPAKKLVNHIKYKSGMKSNLSHIPQDGHLSFNANGRQVDLRVSTVPTEFIESVVMRVLDSHRGIKTFTELGFDKYAESKINSVLRRKNGMVLVTGPTGSGKTTTLYSMLAQLNEPERKLITLEDPIEYHLDNVTQSQVASNSDYNFSNGLKALLRHDPDVILIGEIRDFDTAKLTTEASLTGHVVLSSLHTNSAVGAITRLRNLGLEDFNIAASLNAVLAQRLLRKVCPQCVKNDETEIYNVEKLRAAVSKVHQIYPELSANITTSAITDETGNDTQHHFLTSQLGAGCEKCSHTGYLGQTVITEALLLDSQTQELIAKETREKPLLEAVQAVDKTFLTLFEDGVKKVLQGETTLDEVYRVAG